MASQEDSASIPILDPNTESVLKISGIGAGAFGKIYSVTIENKQEARYARASRSLPNISLLHLNIGSNYSIPAAESVQTKQFAIKRNAISNRTRFMGNLIELDLLARFKGHPYIIQMKKIVVGKSFTDGISSSTDPLPNPLQSFSPILRYRKEFDNHMRDNSVHFVLEYAQYSLFEGIYTKNLGLQITLPYFVDIALGIEFLHSHGVIHRDLKLENILILETIEDGKKITVAKICDFGLSKSQTLQEPGSPRSITFSYRSPEVCLYNSSFSYGVDIWSLGCMLFELITRTHPFATKFDKGPEDNIPILIEINKRHPEKFTREKIEELLYSPAYTMETPNGVNPGHIDNRYNTRTTDEAHNEKARKSLYDLLLIDHVGIYKNQKSEDWLTSFITAHLNVTTRSVIAFTHSDNAVSNNKKNFMEDFFNIISQHGYRGGFGANQSELAWKEFDDLFSRMMSLCPSTRFNITEVLNSKFIQKNPFFERKINTTRANFPLTKPTSGSIHEILLGAPKSQFTDPLSNLAFIQRNKIGEFTLHLFERRKAIPCYTHRRLFQAIDLYERFIAFCLKNPFECDFWKDKNPKYFLPDPDNTIRIHAQFMCCFYISMKYFSSTSICVDYEILFPEEFKQPRYLEYMENFEAFLILKVFRCLIYRDTIYEISDLDYNRKDPIGKKILGSGSSLTIFSDEDVENLIRIYFSIPQEIYSGNFIVKKNINYEKKNYHGISILLAAVNPLDIFIFFQIKTGRGIQTLKASSSILETLHNSGAAAAASATGSHSANLTPAIAPIQLLAPRIVTHTVPKSFPNLNTSQNIIPSSTILSSIIYRS